MIKVAVTADHASTERQIRGWLLNSGTVARTMTMVRKRATMPQSYPWQWRSWRHWTMAATVITDAPYDVVEVGAASLVTMNQEPCRPGRAPEGAPGPVSDSARES